MSDKNKMVLFSSFILLALTFVFFTQKGNGVTQVNPTKSEQSTLSVATSAKTEKLSPLPNSSEPKKVEAVIKELELICKNSKSKLRGALSSGAKPVTEQLAKNLHYKRGGEIFRLRVFTKDTPENSYKKLIFYKEDADGFAQIQEIPKEDQRNPSTETIKKYLSGGEIIYDERDTRLGIDGVEVNYTQVNGEIVKVTSGALNCHYDKP